MNIKVARIYTSICAIISVALGASVIFGWYTHNISLIQVSPLFAPMQYNTALGFLLSGLSVLLLCANQNRLSKIIGLIVFSIGAATLCQYIFSLNFGIDEFFMDHGITTKTSHPGRMAPNTALCFSLYGLALSIGQKKRTTIISLGSGVMVLGIVSILGYLLEEESIYGWGNLTRMAIHTASGFIILSSALIVYGLFTKKLQKFEI